MVSSEQTVFSGHEHVLHQTLIALAAGHGLDEHDGPGDATVYVLHGRVRLHEGDNSWDGSAGDLLIVPASRHRLDAHEDSAVLLTVGKHDGPAMVTPTAPRGNSAVGLSRGT